MGINKVQYGNTTLIDLTSDTVTPSVLMEGYTAHDRSGAVITGTATGGGTGAISVVDTEDTHGGTIRTITAVDISDTTAVANDVAQGKYFYTADGTKTEGTSTGGGGGGLEYETGTWTPTEDIARPTINFTKTHTSMPLFVSIEDNTDTYDATSDTNYVFCYECWDVYHNKIWASESSYLYGKVTWNYRASNASAIISGAGINLTYPSTNSASSNNQYPRYWVTETEFKPYTNSTTRYWRAGRTYKWIAVWAPTT